MKKSCIEKGITVGASVLTVLYGLCRCFSINTKVTLYGLIILVFMSIFHKGRITITIYDVFMFCIPIFVLLNRNSEYPPSNCLFVVLASLLFFNTRSIEQIRPVLTAIFMFSLLNMVVNILNAVAPNTYFVAMKHVLSSASYDDAVFYYKNFGYLSGLSDHYSRNAFFCVAGATIAAAFVFTRKQKKIFSLLYMMLSIVLIMVIGKRGHLLFLVAGIIILYILLAPSLPKKIMNLLKIAVTISIIFGTLIETVPAVSYVFERMIAQKASGDISTGRFDLWNIAWNLFKNKPIIGWGYGYFSTHVFNETLQVYFAGVHNDYLQWLCEQGFVGFIMNVIPYIGLYYLSIKELKNRESIKNDMLYTALAWSILFQTFVLLYSFTGLPHFDYEVNFIYIISLDIPIIVLNRNPNLVKAWKRRLVWK